MIFTEEKSWDENGSFKAIFARIKFLSWGDIEKNLEITVSLDGFHPQQRCYLKYLINKSIIERATICITF